jgi:hypothetical protein
VARVFFSFAFTGGAEWLAWVASDEDVNGFDCGPVDEFDVSMIRYLRPVFFQYSYSVFVYF